MVDNIHSETGPRRSLFDLSSSPWSSSIHSDSSKRFSHRSTPLATRAWTRHSNVSVTHRTTVSHDFFDIKRASTCLTCYFSYLTAVSSYEIKRATMSPYECVIKFHLHGYTILHFNLKKSFEWSNTIQLETLTDSNFCVIAVKRPLHHPLRRKLIGQQWILLRHLLISQRCE